MTEQVEALRRSTLNLLAATRELRRGSNPNEGWLDAITEGAKAALVATGLTEDQVRAGSWEWIDDPDTERLSAEGGQGE